MIAPTAPKRVWHRPIKVDFRKLFSAVGKIAVDVGTGSWPGAVKDGFGVLDSLGLGSSPEEVAGLLVARALTRTVIDLIEPYRRDFPEEVNGFDVELREFLGEREYTIDERFLDHPRELKIVVQFQHAFEGWLKFVNMRGHVAATIAARMPARFVYALHRECVERPDDYAKLFAALEGRFTDAWRRERSWEEYRHWLENSLEDSVFGEDFGLRQIFLWPRAWFGTRHETDRPQRGVVGREQKKRHVVELRSHLDAWMSSSVERHDTARVLSGDPGAGKSSFARMYAAHRMMLGDRVLLVPLHMLNVAHDLREALVSLCAATPPFPNTPFEDGQRLLLILDGLDELSKQGNSGARLAREFAQHVQQLLNTRNLGDERLRVILSGRPIAIQELETDFRGTGQILHLLPYKAWSSYLSDPHDLLREDQRDVWWRRYGELTDRPCNGLPAELAGESLYETTVQPLLGFLLALVYRDALARHQTFSQGVSLNDIYARLLQSVYERDYDKAAGRSKTVHGLTLEQFQELLEEMALVAWHTNARIVRVSHLAEACARSGLGSVLRAYVDRAQTGVSQLFTAFYFRRSGARAGDDEVFEFTHKSFAEYLVARRFVAEVAVAANNLAERATSTGRQARGKDIAAVLLDWLYVFGPNPITRDLVPYLEAEVRLRAGGKEVAAKWQDALRVLVEEVFRYGFPCERVEPGLTFKQMLRWSANAELALLAMLQFNAMVSERHSEVAWESDLSCRYWIERLRASAPTVLLALGWMKLSGQSLGWVNIQNASLDNANLIAAKLQHANGRFASLRSAWLPGANLSNSDFSGAKFVSASLSFAHAMNADFSNANFHHADLQNANLQNANLQNANLQNANLQNANLQNANLQDANLSRANLAGAHISPEQLATARGRRRLP